MSFRIRTLLHAIDQSLIRGVLISLILLPSLAYAQYISPHLRQIGSGTTLTVGPSSSSVFFSVPDSLDSPSIMMDDISGIGVRLAGRSAALTAAYATNDDTDGRRVESISANLLFGPTISPRHFDVTPEATVSIYVPIRFVFGYNYVSQMDLTTQSDDSDVFHLLRAGVGIGAGVVWQIDTPSTIAPQLSGKMSFVLAPGVLTDFSDDPFKPTFAQRSTEFDLELRVESLGNSRIGLVIGYTVHSSSSSLEPVSEFNDVLGAFRAKGFQRQGRLSMFRIGIVF